MNVRYKTYNFTLWVTAIFWFIFWCGTGVLRTTHSISAFCDADEEWLDTHSSITAQELLAIQSQDCKISIDDTLAHNLVWLVGFQLGINFTHLDFLPSMTLLTFSADFIAQWPWYLFVFAATLICLVIWLLVTFFSLIALSGWHVIALYLAWTAAFFIANLLLNAFFPHGVHYHHWYNMLMIGTFAGHQATLVTSMNGFFLAVFVEGACRWSIAPVWQFTKRGFNEKLINCVPSCLYNMLPDE